MTDDELDRLLSHLESDRTERKASAANSDRIRQAICAFANDMPNHDEPGVLFIGVNDNGSCANLGISDELLRTLADMRSDGNIVPLPSLTVQRKTLNGCEMAVIVVHPSDYPPVRYKGQVWIRVGPRRATATVDEERRLSEKRRAKDLPFDVRPIASATIHDLDLDLFERNYRPASVAQEVIEQNDRPPEQQLSSLRFATTDSPPIPTAVGIITVGKSPADLVPGAYVQFLRIDGKQLSDPIADQKECHGPLPELLGELDTILKANIRIATDIKTTSTEQKSPDYPLEALQQYVRNAVMHRNYESSNAPTRITWFLDRVEIQSPGGPFGQVTPENFGEPGVTDYRNPNIAEAMKNLGYVQRFGVGLQVAHKALQENGNPDPELRAEDNHVLVVVKSKGTA
jgi:ATP-dependent DNA helicase RecG